MAFNIENLTNSLLLNDFSGTQNLMDIEIYLNRIRTHFPGFQGFNSGNAEFDQQERNYKLELVDLYSNTVADLLENFPTDDQEQIRLGEAITALFTTKLKGMENKPQNLAGFRYVEPLKFKGADNVKWAQLVRNLIFGKEPLDSRINEFVSGLRLLIPSDKNVAFAALSRSITSILLMASDPNKHVVIKTLEFNRALKAFGYETMPDHPLTGEEYLRIQKFLSNVKAELEKKGLHPRDMIDVQSFLWVGDEKTYQSPEQDLSTSYTHSMAQTSIAPSVNYWMVGAFWESQNPADQTPRFLAAGVWENGYNDKFIDDVKSMKVGDKIAIKACKTQKLDLPFDSGGKTVSAMLIKATGTIIKNLGNGKKVEVKWDPVPALPRTWYFYTGRLTVWRLKKSNELAQHLIRFVFDGKPQDYQFFVEEWYGKPQEEVQTLLEEISNDIRPYAIADMIEEGVFWSESEIELALRRLKAKKNLILQGAPGVGKTFVAKRLAYALMESADDSRIKMVQFHPSYSYEDFIRGYRPTNEAGKFELMDGAFWQLCETASQDVDYKYVMIIDEINRGNLSQVFGELFMLLEADKRGKRHEVTPLYCREKGESFFIPENLYLIGTMNIADRSLALVDYALRRRFSFIPLEPQFHSISFNKWMKAHGATDNLIQLITSRIQSLNTRITNDNHLGPAFQIGHSFFCPKEKDDFSSHGKEWFAEIIETEILPLLDEYWYDAPEKVKTSKDELLA